MEKYRVQQLNLIRFAVKKLMEDENTTELDRSICNTILNDLEREYEAIYNEEICATV